MNGTDTLCTLRFSRKPPHPRFTRKSCEVVILAAKLPRLPFYMTGSIREISKVQLSKLNAARSIFTGSHWIPDAAAPHEPINADPLVIHACLQPVATKPLHFGAAAAAVAAAALFPYFSRTARALLAAAAALALCDGNWRVYGPGPLKWRDICINAKGRTCSSSSSEASGPAFPRGYTCRRAAVALFGDEEGVLYRPISSNTTDN